MNISVKIPSPGESITEVELAKWLVEDGKELNASYIILLNGFGSENRCTQAFNTKQGIIIRCGCWCGTIDQFKNRIKKTRNNFV